MREILREPLVHFLALGGALFALFAIFGADGDVADAAAPVADERDAHWRGNKVVVSAGKIEQLAAIFAKTWQRPPSEVELKGIIDDFVLEEIYYREALARGIDEDDTMIRRRLRQKLEFLTDDLAAGIEPTDEELDSYLKENAEKFRADPRYTFRHVYFNPERHGEDAPEKFKALADELRGGGEVEGDQTLLPEGFEDATSRQVDGTFGTGFAAQLDDLTPGVWSDPLISGLGYHLVLLEDKSASRLPELGEVRAVVAREWSNEKREELRGAFNEKLLEVYEVEVEWPEAEVPQP